MGAPSTSFRAFASPTRSAFKVARAKGDAASRAPFSSPSTAPLRSSLPSSTRSSSSGQFDPPPPPSGHSAPTPSTSGQFNPPPPLSGHPALSPSASVRFNPPPPLPGPGISIPVAAWGLGAPSFSDSARSRPMTQELNLLHMAARCSTELRYRDAADIRVQPVPSSRGSCFTFALARASSSARRHPFNSSIAYGPARSMALASRPASESSGTSNTRACAPNLFISPLGRFSACSTQ